MSARAVKAAGVLQAKLEAAQAEILELREQSIGALRLVADIRFALGDRGARMQDELLDYCKSLSRLWDVIVYEPYVSACKEMKQKPMSKQELSRSGLWDRWHALQYPSDKTEQPTT